MGGQKPRDLMLPRPTVYRVFTMSSLSSLLNKNYPPGRACHQFHPLPDYVPDTLFMLCLASTALMFML